MIEYCGFKLVNAKLAKLKFQYQKQVIEIPVDRKMAEHLALYLQQFNLSATVNNENFNQDDENNS